MRNLINAFPLYNFLKYCNDSSLKKIILDCGAGGINPPLSLFYDFGYETYGIEISEEQLEKSNLFSNQHNIDLNISKGDMLEIPFGDESFSFLYSYNTSVHMRKKEFIKAIVEFNRVLKTGGLCYVNFLSKECDTYGKGIEVSNGEFKQKEGNKEVCYCHYSDSEVEKNLDGFDIIYKEKRMIIRKIDGKECTSAYIDYILKKNDF